MNLPSSRLVFDTVLQQALLSLPEGITILDGESRIVFLNEAAGCIARQYLGLELNINDRLFELLSPGRVRLAARRFRQVFSGQTIQQQHHCRYQGSELWFEFQYYPLFQEDGACPLMCIRSRNITETVMLQNSLETQRLAQHHAVLKATLDAQEKQRFEIGRELHDNVNQVLTTVKLYNEICLSEERPDKNMLLRSVQQINYCIETLRGLSKSLAAPAREEMGLKESIRELTSSIDATRKTNVSFKSFGVKDELVGAELQTTIYRIAQEQLTNVLKYAKADTVEVMLVGTSDTIALSIQDDGEGFVFHERRNGVGITNMISRTQAFGGEIEFITSPGAGCRLMVEFPLTTG